MSASCSSSSLITQRPAPLTPEKLAAARPLAQFFSTTTPDELLNAKTPLFTLFQLRMNSCLSRAAIIDSTVFPSMVYSFSRGSSPHLKAVFSVFAKSIHPPVESFRKPSDYQALVDYQKFKRTDIEAFHSNATLYCFYQILSHALENQDLSDLSSFLAYLKLDLSRTSLWSLFKCIDFAGPLAQFNDLKLFNETPASLGINGHALTAAHHYRMGMRFFLNAFQQLDALHIFSFIERGTIPSHLKTTRDASLFLAAQAIEINRELGARKDLPSLTKRSINSAIYRSLRRLVDADFHLEVMKMRFFSAESLTYYQKVICSKVAQEIAVITIIDQFDVSTITPRIPFNPDDPCSVHPEYATEHRDVFENFIARFHEVMGYFESVSEQAQTDLKMVKEMPLFIRFGNMERLAQRLRDAKANPAKADQILLSEMARFSEEKNTLAILPRLVSYLKNEGARFNDPKRKNDFQSLEDKWTRFPQALQLIFRPSILQAEKSLPDLFIASVSSPPKHSYAPKIEVSSRAEPSVPTEIPLEPSSSSGVSSSSAQPEPSFNSQLQTCRNQLKTWEAGLLVGRHGLTQQALKDGCRHLDDLLCSMRRLQNSSERKPLTPEELFAFINDTVRHCTLGVEQILSALDRTSNQITDPTQLSLRLTHDLFLILQNCNMGNGDLSPQVRRWIRETNRGEILVRDVALFTEKNSALQNLLWASYDLRMGEPSASPQQVFEALSAYLAPLGEFLNSIQHRFPETTQFHPVQLDECMSQLYSTFSSQLAMQPVIPAEERIPLLEKLHHNLETFQQLDPTSELFYRLTNLRSNPVTHLEVELSSHALLEPIEASLHLSNVLLLSQTIVEEILIDARNILGVPVSFEEETQHDLMAHIEKMGIRKIFTKQEIDFLSSGKGSRQLIRYPESRAKKSAVPQRSARGRGKARERMQSHLVSRLDLMGEMLSWGRSLSSKQSAADDLQGFHSVDPVQEKKLNDIKKFVLQDVELMTSIVEKVLHSCRESLSNC